MYKLKLLFFWSLVCLLVGWFVGYIVGGWLVDQLFPGNVSYHPLQGAGQRKMIQERGRKWSLLSLTERDQYNQRALQGAIGP